MAGDPAGALLLVALGVRHLSMCPMHILPVKDMLRRLRLDKIDSLVDEIEKCDSSRAIYAVLEKHLKTLW